METTLSETADVVVPLAYGLPKITECLPQRKESIDQQLFREFFSGRVSSRELAIKLTSSYHQLLFDAFTQSGLGQLLHEHHATLAAIGSFSRNTMSTRSDWDTAIIFPKKIEELRHPVFTELSDLASFGIEIKFGSRSAGGIGSLFTQKKGLDAPSIRALHSASLVIGDQGFLDSLRTQYDNLIVRHFSPLFQQLEQLVRKQESAYGSLFKRAEFNLKDARGGLRDIDTISFIEHMCSLKGLSSGLSDDDRNAIEESSEALLRAKHALHFSYEGRKRGAADIVNIWDNRRREKLLQYYKGEANQLLSSKAVYDLISKSALRVKAVLDQMLEHVAFQIEQRPPRLLQYCLLEPTAFGNLLKGQYPIFDTVGQLFESGNLSKLIPEFGDSEFYVDKAGFHYFPIGEHHVRTLAEVERLMGNGARAAIAEHQVRNPKDRAPLLLAALLHDIAKPDEEYGGDHSLIGEEKVYQIALRIGFSTEQAERASHLVRDHMIIPIVAGHSRFNIITPELLARVPSIEYLQELLILTLADKKESNPDAWSPGRREGLLKAYQQLEISLDGGPTYHKRVTELVIRDLQQVDEEFNQLEVEEYVNSITLGVLMLYSPQVLAEKFRMMKMIQSAAGSSEPAFLVKSDLSQSDNRSMSIIFAAPDSDGLLARVSAVLKRSGRSLTSALVDTRAGIACDLLSIQWPKDVAFIESDHHAFIARLRKAVLNIDQPRQSSDYSSQSSSPTDLAGVEFKPTVKIDLHFDSARGEVSLILKDDLERDVFSLITPVLERNKLNIVNAQIGCGNRGLRHFFVLKVRSNQSADLEALRSELVQSFS